MGALALSGGMFLGGAGAAGVTAVTSASPAAVTAAAGMCPNMHYEGCSGADMHYE